MAGPGGAATPALRGRPAAKEHVAKAISDCDSISSDRGEKSVKPQVTAFFDEATFTVSYVVNGPGSSSAAIIDSVLDFDPRSGRTTTDSADRIIAHVRTHGLKAEWILETHVHADHLSAGAYLKSALGGCLAIGDHVGAVQSAFKKI